MNTQPAAVLDSTKARTDNLRRRTQDTLNARDRDRDIHTLHAQGHTQRQIAEIVGVSQPHVHRILNTPAPTATPDEIIMRAFVDQTPRDELVATLSGLTYTDGHIADGTHDGYQPGTFDALPVAVLTGMLTQNEFDQIVAAIENTASR